MFTKCNKNLCLNKELHTNVYSGFFRITKKLEKTCISTGELINKLWVSMEYYLTKNKIHNNVDEFHIFLCQVR